LKLGEKGRAAVRELGIQTAIDLREPVERELDGADLDGLGITVRFQPIIGGDFQAVKGMSLEELYRLLLEERAASFTEVIRTLAERTSAPALIFCSAGKDRTGLVSALVLGALGVSDDDIVADYSRSEQNMCGAFRASIEARAIAAGINEQEIAVKVGAPPSLMRQTLAWLGERYGGAAGYLRAQGLSESELEGLRRGLVEPLASAA
jgi:protein-tyrosine phosphatase